MDIATLLQHLSEQIEDLEKRHAVGEDVEAEKEKLEAQKKELQQQEIDRQKKEQEDKLTSDRDSEQREQDLKAQADQITNAVVERIQKNQSEADNAKSEQDKLNDLVKAQVSEALGGDLDEAVTRALAELTQGSREGSRFVGAGASESFVDHVANGGTSKTIDRAAGTTSVDHVGAKKWAKDALESKSLGRFFNVIAKASKSEFLMHDGEKEFLRQVMGVKATPPIVEGTDADGGFLVPEEWMPDLLGLLRAQAVVRQAGPRTVPFNKQMNQTSISTGATAQYTAESAVIAASGMTFAESVLLTPKNLTALVPVSNYLLADADGADSVIRDDMIEVMALREDLAFLRGPGTGGEPRGFTNIVGITSDPITVPTNGFQPTISELRRIKAVLRNQNSGATRLAWFFAPQFLTYLETLTDADGHFLLDTSLLSVDGESSIGVNGRFDGVSYFTSTQIPVNLTQGSATNATDLTLVNMADTIVGDNQSLEVAVSSEASWDAGGATWHSAFQQNQTLFRTVLRHDIAHRRPAQVIVQTGVLID